MNSKQGFTLLELLIVIAIIAVLATIIVLVLNPAEILKKSRDSQRMSDVNALKSALSLYLADVSNPSLGLCGTNIWTSIDSATTMHALTGWTWKQVSATNLANIDASGWIPVSFETMTGGTPISNLPIDPVNTEHASDAAQRWYYTYVCDNSAKRFTLTAKLESSSFSDKMAKDGGQFSGVYEIGTKLKILQTSDNPY